MAAPKIDWRQLGQKLFGYEFQRPELLCQALTHRSFNGQHNERLEFLGDALLQAMVSAYLYEHRPQLSEGQLSRLRVSVVRGSTLSDVARRLQLGPHLQLGPGERKTGGERRESILEDCVEALIAALYLDMDRDFNRCQALVLQLLRPELEALPSGDVDLTDAKTRLQEWLQSRGLPLPSYEIVREEGPLHERLFEVRATSGNLVVQAIANRRKIAEQQCAEALYRHYCHSSRSQDKP